MLSGMENSKEKSVLAGVLEIPMSASGSGRWLSPQGWGKKNTRALKQDAGDETGEGREARLVKS